MKDKGLNILFLLLLPIVDTALCVVLLLLDVTYNQVVRTILSIASLIASSCAGIAATIEFVKEYYEMERITTKRIILLTLSLGIHLIIDGVILTHGYNIWVLSVFAFLLLPGSILLLVMSIKSSLTLKDAVNKKREEEVGFNVKNEGKKIEAMTTAVVNDEEYNLEGNKNED